MIEFEKNDEKRELGIVSTDDERLVLIDPTSEGFFANVLGYDTENEMMSKLGKLKNEEIKEFIEAIKEVKEAGVGLFWKPIYDPSFAGGEVVFEAGRTPAVGYSYNFWKQKAEEMPAVEGKKWKLGTEYQYYAFLTWLINQLVANGQDINNAIYAVVLNSQTLGNYRWDDENGYKFEKTGSKLVCGVYDLANTHKILKWTNEEVTAACIPGGTYFYYGDHMPIAQLGHWPNVNYKFDYGVGWLVLA